MARDVDGYGEAPGDRSLSRLLTELRELDRSGVERIHHGWDRGLGREKADRYRSAEQSGLEQVEKAGRQEDWARAQEQVLALTQGEGALTSWRSEPPEVQAVAERAALGAALALVAGDPLGQQERRALLAPAAAALPWLLEETDPA